MRCNKKTLNKEDKKDYSLTTTKEGRSMACDCAIK